MNTGILSAFSTSGFMPHGMCYMWAPSILWTHVISDIVIGLSYFSIPIVLTIFAARRPDIAYRPVMWLFTAFILLCGTSHFFSIWTVWTPDYMAEGLIKAATALVSVATAIALWPLLPRALAVPSPAMLQKANDSLQDEVTKRSEAEAELTVLADSLEKRVEVRTRDLARSNMALDQFTATVSHDLKSPLRHVRLFAELLQRDEQGALSEQGRDYLEKLSGGVDRMQVLIDALLTYSRLAHVVPDQDPVSIGDIINRILEERREDFADGKARLEAMDLPKVIGDPVLLQQLFDNLIGNALKYAGGSTPVIEIYLNRQSADHVEIAVKDNGIGIPEEHVEHVFEMMRGFDESGQVNGLGVGLAFCRQIVESHGGSIKVDTNITDGACFLVSLPTKAQRRTPPTG